MEIEGWSGSVSFKISEKDGVAYVLYRNSKGERVPVAMWTRGDVEWKLHFSSPKEVSKCDVSEFQRACEEVARWTTAGKDGK